MRKKQQIKMRTPKGTAIWPWLNEPNRKFEPAGVYAVNLRMMMSDAQDFIDNITKVRDEHHNEQTKELKKKIKKAMRIYPCVDSNSLKFSYVVP